MMHTRNLLTMTALLRMQPLLGFSFVPPTRSRGVTVTRRSLSKNGWMTMWGEENAGGRPVIPSSSPQRRASGWSDSRNGRDDSWYNDDGSEQRRAARPTRRSVRDDRSNGSWDSGGWDDTSSGGWDDFATSDSSYKPYVYDKPSSSRKEYGRERKGRPVDGRGKRNEGGRGGGRRREGGRTRDENGRNGRGGGRKRIDPRDDGKTVGTNVVKTNLKEIVNAGYEHLYGIAPVLNALKANVRDFSDPDDKEEIETDEIRELQRRLLAVDGAEWDEDEVSTEDKSKPDIKPEAKLAPCLFVQEGTLDNTKRSFRSAAKNEASNEIISLARQIDLNIVEVDKGVLNTLCGNRPHQGFVLRCGGLEFTPLKSRTLPLPSEKGMPTLWLALDEVVDPQNLGALLRSAFFMGGGCGVIKDGTSEESLGGSVGILVCSKNSSPLTPAVSTASAGALEFMTVYSTSNLPKLLYKARDDGWRILGAAADVPETGNSRGSSINKEVQRNDWDFIDDDLDDDEDHNSDITEYTRPSLSKQEEQTCYNLNEVEVGPPTILVLGSEGRGLRTLVARACGDFVKIPGGFSMDRDTQAGLDSLNVSVSGGIFLFHFCNQKW